MDLEREGKRLLERDVEWAALSSSGQDAVSAASVAALAALLLALGAT